MRPLIALLLAWTLGGCSVEILHDLDEEQANQVLDALQREGVQGRKIRSTRGDQATYVISVPRSTAPEAWRMLRQQNLPRQQHKGLAEVFGNVGLVPTATQERALMRQALSGELARTLESFDGVREARVHVVLPVHDRLATEDRPRARPRASVLIRLVGSGAPPVSEAEVRKLVAGAVDGLSPEDVSVVIARGAAATGAAAGVAGTVGVGPFEVAAGSRGPLLATLVVTVLLLCGMSLALLFAMRRGRALARQLEVRAEARAGVEGPDYLSRVSLPSGGSMSQLAGVSPDRSRAAARHTGSRLQP